MNDHPLTEDECKRIAACYPYNRVDIEDCGHIHDMRAAADWQLEQAEKWLDDNLHDYLAEFVCNEYKFAKCIIKDFKQAMRPQEDN